MEVTKKQIRDWIRDLESLPCSFWACEGSHSNRIKEGMTCRKCWVVFEMRQLLKE